MHVQYRYNFIKNILFKQDGVLIRSEALSHHFPSSCGAAACWSQILTPSASPQAKKEFFVSSLSTTSSGANLYIWPALFLHQWRASTRSFWVRALPHCRRAASESILWPPRLVSMLQASFDVASVTMHGRPLAPKRSFLLGPFHVHANRLLIVFKFTFALRAILLFNYIQHLIWFI